MVIEFPLHHEKLDMIRAILRTKIRPWEVKVKVSPSCDISWPYDITHIILCNILGLYVITLLLYKWFYGNYINLDGCEGNVKYKNRGTFNIFKPLLKEGVNQYRLHRKKLNNIRSLHLFSVGLPLARASRYFILCIVKTLNRKFNVPTFQWLDHWSRRFSYGRPVAKSRNQCKIIVH